MAAIAHYLFFFFFFFLFLFTLKSAKSQPVCDAVACGEIQIHFPFGLKGANQNPWCSIPGFQLSCNNRNRTMITLPDSGDLVVKGIDYEAQTVRVNAPDGCLANRFVHNLSLSLPPQFTFDATVYELTFFRCPSNVSYPFPPISCLSGGNGRNDSSVTFFSWWTLAGNTSAWGHECQVISTAFVPIPNARDATSSLSLPDLNRDIQLKWNDPACGECAARGQRCGFIGSPDLQVGCLPGDANKTHGLSRSARYGLTIGVGIPGLLCLIGLCCFTCNKLSMYRHGQRARPINVFPSSITTLQLPSFVMGLNGPEIENFPKTTIGESGRLPNSNYNTCPICLSEYQPKETLRTIPSCNHYFHAPCIDEWLKMNATCPLCRNSPDTPSPSTLSATTSSSSALFVHSSLP